jgi:ligand-binding SRPBCC domain-containing protein
MRDFRNEPITESIDIHAPIERVFALSTRVELVKETLGMSLVGGVTSGSIAMDSRVVWRGWKFGLPTEHHTLITSFAAPVRQPDGEVTAFFQDTQERGRFAYFQHDHFFNEHVVSHERGDAATQQPMTTLHDEIHFELPFGPLGRVAAALLLAPHIRRLARQRFARIKALAESDGPDGWRAWVGAGTD